ncbi:MAG: DNA mismatch repair endonuclease MutL [Ruminococcaceae bacterium]|nr:DNA mismatch repair endonuclease MutL [Oscillospiraceae bacterium]
MGRINVLSFAVANLIAAGEVVDRPASVIKELVENAIDSGADRITIELQNGGVTYMRVADNGCGMAPEDLPVSIRRHATSKIKDAKDLESILTLGFRGEALAAIASVSDLRIISKTKDAEVGAMLEAHGGNIYGVTERACSDGTTVIVENLFSNVPARRKFLKKDVTEAMAVIALVEKIALSKPYISFRLISDGNIRLETVGDGNLKNTVYSVFGKDFASRLIETRLTLDGIEVFGFVGRSDNVRANRNYQNFFINGRYVKSKTAGAALEQAYTSYIPPEKFPCCVLFLNIHPAAVDVNVHPAKLEVKFSNEKPVFEAVYYAVRNALETNSTRPNVSLQPASKRSDRIEAKLSDSTRPIEEGKGESLKKRQLVGDLYTAAPKENPLSDSKGGFARMSAEEYLAQYLKSIPKEPLPKEAKLESKQSETQQNQLENKQQRSREKTPVAVPKSTTVTPVSIAPSVASAAIETASAKEEAIVPVPTESLQYRILGEAFHSYVFVEVGDKVLVIDKHAAHERILFEGLKAGMNDRNKASQLLMIPLEILMTSDEIQILSDYRSEIEAVGFAFTTGRYTVSVTEVPEGIAGEAVADMLTVIAERLRSHTGSAKLTRDILFEKALYQASCKAAIKAGREYPEGHIQWLVAKLMELPDITVCPHGRPVAMELSKKQLDHQFERT